MLTFTTFGAGFLMRPLGAIILGAYVDQVGRRKGLIVTLAIMALGTLLIAFVPGYATIGLAAPLLVLIGRLLQGFSAGVELGGVSVYLSEMATPGHKGFYVALAVRQPAGGDHRRGADRLSAQRGAAGGRDRPRWGWRIPFFIGCADRAVPVLHPPLAAGDRGVPRAARTVPSTAEIFRSHAGRTGAIVLPACCWW